MNSWAENQPGATRVEPGFTQIDAENAVRGGRCFWRAGVPAASGQLAASLSLSRLKAI